ncbi:MAG: DUF6220 domain-containing protein [Actinomycetota bacterium]|nr:DUF6220 domain-containing protein [Actinomycetota bacterium]
MALTDTRLTAATAAPTTEPASGTGTRRSSTAVLHFLVRVFAAAVVVQFYLAGRGVFAAKGEVAEAGSLDPHRILGSLLALVAVAILVTAMVARPGRGMVLRTVLLLALTVGQGFLAQLGSGLPWVFGALHPVNALLIAGLAVTLVRDTRHRSPDRPT